MDARTEFNRIFGDVVMSDNDAAWYIFKAGWNAARAAGPYKHPESREQEGRAKARWFREPGAWRKECED